LRKGSYNQALLRAAQRLAPAEIQIRIHDLSDIPLFSEDIERTAIPPAVISLREAVAQADGFLVATPEYNHGVPGVMRNAFDWLSHPPGKSVLNGKPSGIVGASPGITCTARSQSQLPGHEAKCVGNLSEDAVRGELVRGKCLRRPGMHSHTKWSVCRLRVVMQSEDATSRSLRHMRRRNLQPQLPCGR
jgi:NADPH-dependent FMN reductase